MSTEPKHIGIILDGNRRFAKRLMLQPWKGHEWGVGKVKKLLDWAKEEGIITLTLYTFSMQNFNRPKEEFNHLMDLFRKEFNNFRDDKRIEENEIRIRILGRKHLFPKDIQEALILLEEQTKDHKKYTINFAMGYGGREEIFDAVKKIAEEVKAGTLDPEQLTEESFQDYLYMKEQPDLIIRTGGDRRTSNFLSFQSAYSEWFFIDKMWPEFEHEDFKNIIEDFKSRQRRFGK
jgi:tritrans,polycis-undecaprenyl-diphosphate synthase [geranylgeranyl-diphosphate specific]